MSYLNINGYATKVRAGHELSPAEIASARGYSPNALYGMQRSAIARAWTFTTIPLPRDEAIALIGMLMHRGDGWSWDTDEVGEPDQTAADFYSDKLRAASTLTAANISPTYAYDGGRIYTQIGASGSGSSIDPYVLPGAALGPFSGSSGVMANERATTNLLPAGESRPNTVDWAVVNGTETLTDDTDYIFDGSSSLKVVTVNAGDGAKLGGTAPVTGGQQYIATIYIRPAAGGENLFVYLSEVGVANTAQYFTLPTDTNTWTRVQVKRTAAGANALYIQVRSVNGGDTFYLACAQIEQQADAPTSWVEGGSSRAAGNVEYAQFLSGWSSGFTANIWYLCDHLSSSTTRYLYRVNGTNGHLDYFNYISISTGDALAAVVSSRPGSSSAVSSLVATSTATVGWHMHTATFDQANQTLRIYKDGALVQSDSTYSGATKYQMSGLDQPLSIGDLGTSASNATGYFGPVQFFPFVAPANIIAGWYNLASDDIITGVAPLVAYGDFLHTGDESVQVYAEVSRAINAPHTVNGVWDPGAMAVSFTLYEATGRA